MTTPTVLAVPTVAILGRPNVGKSTLFNRLTEGDKALVHNQAGTTRDVRRTPARLFDLAFTVLDTAGIEDGKSRDDLQGNLNTLSRQAAGQADVLIMVADGGTGVLPADRSLAQALRKLDKPLLLVVNKGDLNTAQSGWRDFLTLGLGEPVLISAAHNQGLDDLHAALAEHVPAVDDEDTADLIETFVPVDDVAYVEGEEIPAEASGSAAPAANPFTMPEQLRVAVLGRPNVGKSTLVNALLGEDKMLTGPTAGLTREAISHTFSHNGQQFLLVDTPGLRKKTNIVEDIEQLSVGQSLTAANKAHIVILVVDVSTYSTDTGTWELFEQQDARIAGAILNAGKPLIVALNKWDAVREKADCLVDTQAQLRRRLHQLVEPMSLPISAERKKGLDDLLAGAITVYTAYHTRVGTAKLNRLLAKVLAKRSPPLTGNNRTVNLKYATQTTTRPPTFAIWGTRVDDLPDSYKLFLRNQFAEALNLQHVPLRFQFKQSRNPFQGRKK